jgi:hypothetical protein
LVVLDRQLPHRCAQVPSSQSNAIETALATQGLRKFVMLLRGLKEFSGRGSVAS